MAKSTHQGTQHGLPQRTDDGAVLKEMDNVEVKTGIERGVGNDSGTIPGRKVDHRNPLDIPPRGMKRKY
jgi:hypothetical protein